MKLHEITGSEDWLETTIDSHYSYSTRTVGDDHQMRTTLNGKLNIDGFVKIISHKLSGGHIPVKFGKVHGDFYVYGAALRSVNNFPDEVGGNIVISLPAKISSWDYDSTVGNSLITSLVGITPIIKGNLLLNLSKITSFVGINDHIKEIGALFAFDSYNIKSGGIGLLMIESLKRIGDVSKYKSGSSSLSEPFQIIQKYLGTDNIIECQSELIEAGYEDFAIL